MGERGGDRRRRRTAGAVVTAVVATSVLAVGPRFALASFLDTATASGGWSVTTETLQPPTGLTSTGCLLGTVTLTWSASPSGWATGYEVRWSTTNGGPYDRGPLTTTLLTQQVTGLSALTTYYFVVRATRGAWFSANSNQHTASCLV